MGLKATGLKGEYRGLHDWLWRLATKLFMYGASNGLNTCSGGSGVEA